MGEYAVVKEKSKIFQLLWCGERVEVSSLSVENPFLGERVELRYFFLSFWWFIGVPYINCELQEGRSIVYHSIRLHVIKCPGHFYCFFTLLFLKKGLKWDWIQQKNL